MSDLVKRLRENCNGNPAKVIWPHRVLHEAADRIEALTAERDRLRETLTETLELAEEAPELNMSNYDINQVADLNNAMLEVWQYLSRAALKTEEDG